MTLVGLIGSDLRQGARRLRGRGGMLLLIAVVGGGAFFLAAEWYFLERFFHVYAGLASRWPALAERLLRQLIGAFVAVTMTMLVSSGLVASLGTLFRSEDLPWLRAAPLPLPRLLAHRVLRAAVPAALPSLVLVLPLLLALQTYRQGSAPSAVAALVAFMLAAVPCSLLPPALVSALMAWIPPRLVRRFILGVGLTTATAGVVLLRWLRPERLTSTLALGDLATIAAQLGIPGESWSPSTWVASVFVRGGGLGSFVRLATFAIGLSIPCGWLLLRTWPQAWDRSRDEGLPKTQRPAFFRPPSRFLPRLGPASAALIDRELRFFVRDAARWSQIALLAGLLAVYVVNLRSLAAPDPLSRLLLLYVDLATIGFVVASLALRFALPAVSSEGPGIVLIRVSPVARYRVFVAKWLVTSLPSVVVALVLALLTNRFLDIPHPLSTLAVVSAGSMGLALPALAIAIGARYPRFEAVDPAELAVSPLGIATMFLTLGLVAVFTFLACRPLHELLAVRLARPFDTTVPSIAVMLTLGAGICAAAARSTSRSLD